MPDLAATNFCVVGRKYGVSDNAVSKWRRGLRRLARRIPAGASPAAARPQGEMTLAAGELRSPFD
jgi:transposase-like protein